VPIVLDVQLPNGYVPHSNVISFPYILKFVLILTSRLTLTADKKCKPYGFLAENQ
jgi:hypothetical protein